jgi:outer membrane lipoprotein-sorting protein
MKRRIALLLALLSAAGMLWAQAKSAEEIMNRSRNRIEAKTVSTRARMVISAKDGGSTERLVDQYTSTENGIAKTMVIFQKPTSVAGTRFLTIENPGKAADQWIYLPSLGKVRRIAASEGSASFMGTDLSYDDLSSADRDPDLDSYQLLREESLGGRNCWVIEAKPKSSDYQYSRMLGWIDKENYIALKMELYDRKGKLAKIMEMGEVKDIQGRLSPTVTKMSSVQAGTSTTIYIDIMKCDDPIPASVFTERFLLTGRP